ncbi:MAG: ABC transporter permease [Planctomycetes bacterium]|nr:ABC transporter permease [Planctomycetota bacterium]
MSLVRTIAGQSLRQRPARTLFSVLGIAVGIATVVGVFTLDHNTVLGLSLRGAGDWKPAIEVRPAQGVADPGKTLSTTPGVAGYSSFFQNDVVVRDPRPEKMPLRGDGSQRVRLFALDAPTLGTLDAVKLAVGRTLDPSAKEREVLIGDTLAAQLSLQPGDKLMLSRPRRAPREACVDGVMTTLDTPEPNVRDVPVETSFTVVGILLREKLGRRAQGSVVVADSGWARELYRGVNIDSLYWVQQDPNVDLERLRASLGTAFSYDLNKHVLVGAAADERAFRNGVRMAGLFALVLGLYVIFHTLSMSLVERLREVATLHALGATRRQIARIFFFEALVLALFAAALGIAGGLGLARFLLLSGVTTLGTGHRIEHFDIPWPVLSALVGLGVGIALLGSVYPLMRARNQNTVAALRGEASLETSGVARGFHLFAALLLAVLLPALYFAIVPVVGEAQKELIGAVLAAVGFLALFVTLPLVVPALLGRVCSALTRPMQSLWTFSGRAAAAAIRSSPARIAVSSAAIALVAAAFVGLKSMTASLRGEIELWGERALVSKVYVRGLPNARYEDLNAALQTVGVTAAFESGSARSYVPFLLLGQRTSELSKHGPLAHDPALAARMERGDGVILSERLARHLRYAVGDKVHVANAGGGVQDLEVVAISDAYGYFPHPDERLYGVTSDQFMRRAYCQDVETLTECAVALPPGGDAGAVEAALRARWPGVETLQFETGRELLVAHVDDLDRDFKLFDLILGLSALLAALGVLNGQLLSALERAKELGVLKALGVTRKQVTGMVICEALVIGVFGGLLGTALGAALAPVIVRALEALSGLDLPDVGAGVWLVVMPVAAVGIALLAALYPILRMNQTDAVAAVRAP